MVLSNWYLSNEDNFHIHRTRITNVEVDNLVLEALSTLPNIGERLITGYFLSKGITIQRKRVREAIKRVDAEGLAARRERMHRTIRRRVYNVPHPHFIWHLGKFVHIIVSHNQIS